MKTYVYTAAIVALIMGCTSNKSLTANTASAQNDTIRIANDSIEYEVIIIDPGFNSWLHTSARPRGFYSQNYLEARNIPWVTEWNNRYRTQMGNRDLYLMPIDYRQGIDYGYEVNYLLFNYLTYYQLKNNIRLGGFAPRL